LAWVKANLDPSASIFRTRGKHKYLLPLNKAMRKRISHLARLYPKILPRTVTIQEHG
jgi:hypothetical protein